MLWDKISAEFAQRQLSESLVSAQETKPHYLSRELNVTFVL